VADTGKGLGKKGFEDGTQKEDGPVSFEIMKLGVSQLYIIFGFGIGWGKGSSRALVPIAGRCRITVVLFKLSS